jgi:uncharacterized hydrophobic protein (TIGR00341 family)
MALRLIEIDIPQVSWDEVSGFLKDKPVVRTWHRDQPDGGIFVRLLVPADHAGGILDYFEKHFSHLPDFQIIVFPVEASIPRPQPEKEASAPGETPAPSTVPQEKDRSRIAREELYADVAEISKPSSTYVILVVLSSIVAGIGILRDNTAVIIGAMVIAPLLGPNVALALATTLADWNLARRALIALGIGVCAVVLISVGWGVALRADPSMPGIAGQIEIGLGDVALALAAGCAAVLSIAAATAAALVGVMVAVALLPPLVTAGLLLGSGHFQAAQGSVLVFLTNIICINLAGVVTFLFRGVRPLTWWETRKAKKATLAAIIIWVLVLLALVGIITLAQDEFAAGRGSG